MSISGPIVASMFFFKEDNKSKANINLAKSHLWSLSARRDQLEMSFNEGYICDKDVLDKFVAQIDKEITYFKGWLKNV